MLAYKYPNLIQRNDRTWEKSTCRFEAMRERADFRNDFTDNTARFGAFAADILAAHKRLQRDLHATSIACWVSRMQMRTRDDWNH